MTPRQERAPPICPASAENFDSSSNYPILTLVFLFLTLFATARSFFIAEQNAIAHDAQIGTSHLSVTANMTYEVCA